MAVVMLAILGVLAIVTVKGVVPYLWREWITSVDHKRIGVMYMLLGLSCCLRGFSDAIRCARSRPSRWRRPGISPARHYDQIFRARHDHDLFRAMPLLSG